MSVITSFTMKSENNIASTLEKAGILSKGEAFEVPKYVFDKNGVGRADGKRTRYRATIDLSKLWPEDWALCLAEICERGVKAYGEIDSIEEFATVDYIRHIMDKPILPEGRVFDNYSCQYGRWGYFTRDTDFSARSIEFIPFDDETIATIESEAKKLAQMWKPDGDSGIRRDYIEQEIARMPFYPVEFDEDGKCISYCRNYAHGLDELAPNYIAHYLPSERIHLIISTECWCDYEGYSENGVYGKNIAPSREEQESVLYGVAE